MRQPNRFFAMLIVVLATSLAPLHAGLILQFDESGDLAYSLGGNPYVALPNGTLESDPTGGVGGNVLVYNLTSALNSLDLSNGDVPIGGSDGLAGDMRFTDSGGDLAGIETCGNTQCLMIFYVFDSNGLPADIGPVSTSFLTTQTTGTVLNDGKFTFPAGAVSYDGTIVPEPSPAVMLLFGLTAFAVLLKRSKTTRTRRP